MKNIKKSIMAVSLILCVSCFLSSCGGPAGKIQKDVFTKYFYENVDDGQLDGADDSLLDDIDGDFGNSQSGKNISQTNSETDSAYKGGEKTDSEKKDEGISEEEIIEELERLKKTLPEEMPLVGADKESFAYSIVYPDNSKRDLVLAVKTFRSSIQRKLDVSTDAALTDSESPKEKSAELLIGGTNRSFSSKLLAKLKSNRKNCYDDFIIATKGNKIGIVGGSDEACVKAIEWFTKIFCASERTWTYLRKGYEFIYAPKYNLKEISIAGSSIFDFSIVTPDETEYVYGRATDDFIDMASSNLHYSVEREYERFTKAGSQNEILIGNLNRSQSKSVIPVADSYVIKVVDKKVVIKGYDSICLYYGIEEFSKLIKDAAKSGKTLKLNNGYTLSRKINKSSNSVYKLVFNDEFDGALLGDMWTGYDGSTSGEFSVIPNGRIINEGRNNEYQYVKDGILHILSKRIKDSGESGNFGEGKITLKKNLWYKFGCLEVRAKMPLNPAHCAIWLNGGAEVDIVENFSSVTNFRSNLHKWFSRYLWDGTRDDGHLSIEGNATYDAARNYAIDVKKFGNLNDDFHTYSLDWTEDYFRFAVDGKTYFRYNYSENEDEVDFYRRELYLILVCGCGSNSYGAKYVPALHDKLDENGNYVPFDFQIDYVRLYQNPSTDGVNYDRTQ